MKANIFSNPQILNKISEMIGYFLTIVFLGRKSANNHSGHTVLALLNLKTIPLLCALTFSVCTQSQTNYMLNANYTLDFPNTAAVTAVLPDFEMLRDGNIIQQNTFVSHATNNFIYISLDEFIENINVKFLNVDLANRFTISFKNSISGEQTVFVNLDQGVNLGNNNWEFTKSNFVADQVIIKVGKYTRKLAELQIFGNPGDPYEHFVYDANFNDVPNLAAFANISLIDDQSSHGYILDYMTDGNISNNTDAAYLNNLDKANFFRGHPQPHIVFDLNGTYSALEFIFYNSTSSPIALADLTVHFVDTSINYTATVPMSTSTAVGGNPHVRKVVAPAGAVFNKVKLQFRGATSHRFREVFIKGTYSGGNNLVLSNTPNNIAPNATISSNCYKLNSTNIAAMTDLDISAVGLKDVANKFARGEDNCPSGIGSSITFDLDNSYKEVSLIYYRSETTSTPLPDKIIFINTETNETQEVSVGNSTTVNGNANVIKYTAPSSNVYNQVKIHIGNHDIRYFREVEITGILANPAVGTPSGSNPTCDILTNVAPLALLSNDGFGIMSGTGTHRVNDGNYSSLGHNDYQFTALNAIGKTLTLDLDQTYKNLSFILHNRIFCCPERINGTTVTFKNTATGASESLLLNITTAQNNVITLTPNQNFVANKIEITFAQTTVSFREIEVFGICATPPVGTPGGGNPTVCTELLLDPNPQSSNYINSGCWTSNIINTNSTAIENRPQLTSTQAWAAPNNNPGNYVGMMFDGPRGIKGVTTKGRIPWNQWVTTYRLEATKGSNWVSLGNYTGNSDPDTPVFNAVSNTDTDWIGVRIVPLTFSVHMSLRFQFTLCEPQEDSNTVTSCVASDALNNYARRQGVIVSTIGNAAVSSLEFLNDGLIGNSGTTPLAAGAQVEVNLGTMLNEPEIALYQPQGSNFLGLQVWVPNAQGTYVEVSETDFVTTPNGGKRIFKIAGKIIDRFKVKNASGSSISLAEAEATFDESANSIVGGTGGNEFWRKLVSTNTIFHDDGLVRIGSNATLPTLNTTTNMYNSTTGLLVNGHTTFNVGRGNVFLENNKYDDASGAGLTLRTSENPDADAPIFSVRSSGGFARLWIGQEFSSFGSNDFYFGGATAGLAEQDISKFKGILKNDGRVGIGTNAPERALHIRGEQDGIIRIDRNQMGAKILFANYSTDWSTINHSATVGFEENGVFAINSLNGELTGENQNRLLSIDPTTKDVKIQHSLSVGKDAVKIDGAIAHFDGRVYISEEDSKVDTSEGESTTEKGFTSTVSDNYKDFLLWIEKGLVSKDIALVELDDTDWPDYVFNEDYKLNSIEDLKTYIKKNGHLPTMPSAKDVEKNGFTVADMTKRTLKTVEELLLHIIAQEEKITKLKKTLEEYNKLTEDLEEQIKTNKK